jgi:hypothetical protein
VGVYSCQDATFTSLIALRDWSFQLLHFVSRVLTQSPSSHPLSPSLSLIMASEMDTFLIGKPDVRESLSRNPAVPPSIMAPELYEDYRNHAMERIANEAEVLKRPQTIFPHDVVEEQVMKNCTQAFFFEPISDILVYAKTAVRLVDDNWEEIRDEACESVDDIVRGFIIEVLATYKNDHRQVDRSFVRRHGRAAYP